MEKIPSTIKTARQGTRVQPIGTDEEWEVLAKFPDSDEVVLRHPGCLQSTGHVFTYAEFEDQFERVPKKHKRLMN